MTVNICQGHDCLRDSSFTIIEYHAYTVNGGKPQKEQSCLLFRRWSAPPLRVWDHWLWSDDVPLFFRAEWPNTFV